MLQDLTQTTLSSGFWNDQEKAQAVLRKRAQVESKLEVAQRLGREIEDLAEYLELGAAEGDEGVIADADAQADAIAGRLRKVELDRMLSGPADRGNAIVSIHPGAGGTDAKDWASMLLRMYLRFCERRGYKTEIIDYQDGDEAGIDAVTLTVSGDAAYGYLRSEAGVHRLVRMSPFNADHTRQTAFAAVEAAAMPATPLPPVSLSATTSTTPLIAITLSPSSTPSRPARHTLARLMPAPSAKAKNGISTGIARGRKSRHSRSSTPSSTPVASGSTAPTSVCHGNADSPAAPSVTIVRNGPDSTLMIEYAATSFARPSCPISAM